MTEQSNEPLVSFIVPTLNRGTYLLDTVKSVLVAGDESQVLIEVIVIDSNSDDGSWEELLKVFGNDSRLRAYQNARGSGAVPSWLEGARKIRGRFATFIWSDDGIAPFYLKRTLPLLDKGEAVAFGMHKWVHDKALNDNDFIKEIAATGHGASQPYQPGQRHFEYCDSETVQHLSHDGVLHDYFFRNRNNPFVTITPGKALFRADVLRCWTEEMATLMQSSWLARELLLKNAIGPDLALILFGLEMQDAGTSFQCTEAQINLHRVHFGQIGQNAGTWRMDAGYRIVNALFYCRGRLQSHFSDDEIYQTGAQLALLLFASLRAIGRETNVPIAWRSALSLSKHITDIFRYCVRRDGIAGAFRLVRAAQQRRHINRLAKAEKSA
ncbi:MAG: glycosyltransferase family 2 protein [Pseudomonadota bacterium]